MNNFIVILTYLVLGKCLRSVPRFPSDTGNALNLFVIYVSLPALVLLKIPELTFSSDLLVPAIMPWAMLLFSAATILLLARLFKWNRETTGALLLLVPLGNTSFLGIPMVKAFFGESGVPYAVLYDQLGSFLALSTYGSLILAVYGQEQGAKPTVRGVGLKIATFPPFISLLAALMLRPFPYPSIFQTILQSLAATLVPVVMIAVGFQLTLKLKRDVLFPLGIGLAVKLAVAPFAALIFCKIAGLSGPAVLVSIFEAGMPPMVSAGALAILAGLSPNLTAALVGIGIVASFATLPLLFQLL